MTDLLPHLLPIAVTFLLSGLVKGVIGLGLPTVAMGLLGLVMPPAQAAVLLLAPSLVTSVWQLLAGPRFGALPLQAAGASLLSLVPALAGMALGGWLRARVRPETFRLCFFVGLLVLGGELVWRGLA